VSRALFCWLLLGSLTRALAQAPASLAPLAPSAGRYYLGLSAQHNDFQAIDGISLGLRYGFGAR